MAACGTFIEPLNLECLLINIFSGTTEIFVFIAFIFIAGLAAVFRMDNRTALLMFVLFGVMMGTFIGGLYLIIVLLAGIAVFVPIRRLVTRQ